MKKQLLAGTLAFGLVGGSLVGAPLQEGNTVEAASWDCQITIDANKHHFGNQAKGTGNKEACGELEGYYSPDKTFEIMQPEAHTVSDGEILKDVWFDSGDSLDVKVNTIGEKTEKPKPDPKPEQPKDPKPEQPKDPKPDPKPEPKPDPKPEPKPEQPSKPTPEKPDQEKPKPEEKPVQEKPKPEEKPVQENPSTGDNDNGTNDNGKNDNGTNDKGNGEGTQTGENTEKDENGVVEGNDNNNNNNGTNKGNNVDNKTTENEEVVGERLPNTATNTYNLGLLGGMLALLGSAVGFVFNRKAKMD